jgi:hypothetical protein
MKFLGAFLVAVALALASPALAQSPATVKLCIPTSPTVCTPVTATAPLPITGSFSATLAGFTPNGNYTSLTATAASSASTTLPAGTVVAFQNLSTIDVSCVLTAGASTATTNKLIVRGGATVYYTVGANTTTACINQTGSASNVVGLAGGDGLGTAFGGGGSGGGGGAITAASGSYASGALSSGSIAAGAMVDLLTMRGTVAAGTAAANSMLTGCIYNSSPITLTTGQGAAVQCSVNGYPTVVVSNTLTALTPGDAIATATYASASPVLGAMLLWNGTTYDRWKSAGATGVAAVRPTDGTRNAIIDPCEANLQTYATGVITSATTTRIVAPSASNKTYACMFFTKASAADNVAVVEGTGGTCGTGTAAVLGGTTTANGLVYVAGDGLLLQAGGKVAAMQTTGTNVDLCLITSTTGPLIYAIKYVQAP